MDKLRLEEVNSLTVIEFYFKCYYFNVHWPRRTPARRFDGPRGQEKIADGGDAGLVEEGWGHGSRILRSGVGRRGPYGLGYDAPMIPPFNDDGYLPPGIHQATLEEVADRFGADSELRRAQMESLRWLVDLAQRAGVLRIVVNGSFATDKLEPNDVDCALLIGADYPRDAAADRELQVGLPFINFELVLEEGFREFTRDVFATDRNLVSKGMVEILP